MIKPDNTLYDINENKSSINKVVEEKLKYDDKSNNKSYQMKKLIMY